MTRDRFRPSLILAAVLALLAGWVPGVAMADEPAATSEATEDEAGLVRVASLVYANEKSSVCFADLFLKDVRDNTHISAHPTFTKVMLESEALFGHPFAVMSGEGQFMLTDVQRENMRRYLEAGGFLLASAGCSSKPWQRSFRAEISKVFPDRELTILEGDHPVFHTVEDITSSAYKSGANRLPRLEALEIDGRVVMIFSPDGLNDTANAGGNCCCCGGNEVKAARKINVNILAYALTH